MPIMDTISLRLDEEQRVRRQLGGPRAKGLEEIVGSKEGGLVCRELEWSGNLELGLLCFQQFLKTVLWLLSRAANLLSGLKKEGP